LHKNTNNLKL